MAYDNILTNADYCHVPFVYNVLFRFQPNGDTD
jgi:hypothetical protein